MKKIIPLFLGFLLVTGSVNAGVGRGIFNLIFLDHQFDISSFFIDWFSTKKPLKKPLTIPNLKRIDNIQFDEFGEPLRRIDVPKTIKNLN